MECHCSSSSLTRAVVTVVTLAASTVILLLSVSGSGTMTKPTALSKFVATLLPPATSLIAKSSEGRASNALIVDDHARRPAETRHHPMIKKMETKMNKRTSNVSRVEEELAAARASIRRAISRGKNSFLLAGDDAPPSAAIYRNPAAFFESYMEMEKRFKVYVYEEGEPPLVHTGPWKNIYTTEGRFIQGMEAAIFGGDGGGGGPAVRTRDPTRAHAFFLPFSVTQMVEFIYQPLSYDHTPIKRFVADYIDFVASKHPFWNRSAGADHFMLSCHDWGPHASRANPNLYKNSIRALCNANTSEGFDRRKDVSIPEICLYSGRIPRQLQIPRPPRVSERPYLAFFAGGLHGPVRPLLLQHWKGRDPALPVYEYLPKGLDYYSFILKSRFCLCPSGYEVASPRVVEAIYAECVPVIIAPGYVLPFSDVLRWEAFSVSVAVEDIPRLKEILAGVPPAELERLREGVRAVKRHFVLNQPPKRFDVFHMILHSVWLRRLNIKLH